LVKKPNMTPGRLAAARANGQLSHGPVTPEGMDRIRASNTRHGFYSQVSGGALPALGEDPAEFQALIDSLLETWRPADAFQERLVMQLASSLWRKERSVRLQDSLAVRKLEKKQGNRLFLFVYGQALAEKTAERLKALAAEVAREDYCTGQAQIELFEDLFESDPDRIPKATLALLRRLRLSGSVAPPSVMDDPEPEDEMPAEGAEREEARKQLLDRLSEEIRICEKAIAACEGEPFEPASPYERDALLVPDHPQAALMMRMEESTFRQIWRLTNLHIRLKGQEKKVVTSDQQERGDRGQGEGYSAA
jgi:hypothetical protein